MPTMTETARHFFDACETGKGWAACSEFCHPDATFAAQADAFAGIDTLEGYTDAMRDLIAGPIPDASYELRAFGVDEAGDKVIGYAVFTGTHSGEGGPVPATGKRVETDYVYVMDFDGDRIRHVTKIWNDGFAMRQMGWG